MHKGYTLLEFSIVVAIISIMAAISWGSVRQYMSRFRMVQVAKSFRGQMMKLRKIAVQTNRETRITFVQDGGDCTDGVSWGGIWTLAVGDKSIGSTNWDLLPEDSFQDNVDNDQSLGTIDIGFGGNHAALDVCLAPWGSFSGPSINGSNNANSIVFGPRGWVLNPNNDFNTTGYIEFQFFNQDAHRNQRHDSITVLLSRAGMVRLSSYEGAYSDAAVGTSQSSTAP